jgi:hypothetical protein
MKQLTAQPSSNRSKGRHTTFEGATARLPPSFYDKLLERLPTASRMELKVCALTSLNYSAREIGRMLSIAPTTVDNHRYRIRKKLQLPPTAPLNVELIRLRLSADVDRQLTLSALSQYRCEVRDGCLIFRIAEIHPEALTRLMQGAVKAQDESLPLDLGQPITKSYKERGH